MNQTKLNAAHDRLIQCSYAFAGILGGMLANGDIPPVYEEIARKYLRQHKAAARERTAAIEEKSA